MGFLDDLLRKLRAVLLLPVFQLLRFVFPDLFDSIADQRSDDDHDHTDMSPLVPSRSSQLPDDPITPLVSPPVLPSNSGQLATAFDLPMPTVEDMPTPDGPLAPVSTRSYKAHGANSGSSNASGSTSAVQHICAADLSSEAEMGLLPHQPTESGESIFGARSTAGPLSDDYSEGAKTHSSSEAMVFSSLGGYRSIGSDLTNLDQSARRELGGARNMLYMRHGERQDMADSNWVNTAPRPWDPPLSTFGLKQAAQRGTALLDSGVAITAVVASPFTRCIQTAVEVMKAYGLSSAALTVDARVCEWMSARNLNLSVVQERLGASLAGDVPAWFWGTAGETGLLQVISNSWSPDFAGKVKIGQMSFPHVHETLAAARSRFQSSLLQLQAEHSGTILVVTHGDALGAVIEQVKPLATVYQVETAGYVQFEKTQDTPKSFSIAGAVGVQWLS